MDIPLTSLVIFLPLLGALVTLAMPSARAVKVCALATTVLTFALSLFLYAGFQAPEVSSLTPQMADMVTGWFPDAVDIKYHVGIDGLNLLLVMLTTLLAPLVVLSSWWYIEHQHRGYYVLLLILQTGVTGVFCSYDIFLFYIFFELTLIPMYFIIGIWGGEERIYAAVKFVLYTLVGSLLMLVGILVLGYAAAEPLANTTFTTDYFRLLAFNVPAGAQLWLFLLFAFSFAIKVPLFPLHTWLPDAHVQAPTGGSVVLAGVLLKMGTYGLVRFCLPFFPAASVRYAWLFAILAVIGIIYGALVARAQSDAKKLVAYSSVSHLGFVVLGIFAFTEIALQGAIIQMINHGISTGALFLLVGMLYERRHTREMADYGGIAKSAPLLTFCMIFTVLASAGLPGLNGFVGEFMILLGTYTSTLIGSPVLVAFATSGVILAAVYLLWMVYRIFFGTITQEANRTMPDMSVREAVLMTPLIVLMALIGFMPQPFLKKSEPAAKYLIELVETKRAGQLQQGTAARTGAASKIGAASKVPASNVSASNVKEAPSSGTSSYGSGEKHTEDVPEDDFRAPTVRQQSRSDK